MSRFRRNTINTLACMSMALLLATVVLGAAGYLSTTMANFYSDLLPFVGYKWVVWRGFYIPHWVVPAVVGLGFTISVLPTILVD